MPHVTIRKYTEKIHKRKKYSKHITTKIYKRRQQRREKLKNYKIEAEMAVR